MKSLTIPVGLPGKDASWLRSGLERPVDLDGMAARPLQKEFRFALPDPGKKALNLKLKLVTRTAARKIGLLGAPGMPPTERFYDAERKIVFFSGEKQVGEFPLREGDNEIVMEDLALSPAEEGELPIMKGVFSFDPFFPPQNLVFLTEISVESRQDLRIPEGYLDERMLVAPVRHTYGFRRNQEITKMGLTYRVPPAEFPYSGEVNTYFGDIHVHTNYSLCGHPFNMTILEKAGIARERGHDFIAFADHSEHMDAGTFEQYFRECREAGEKAGILVLPGIEYSSQNTGHRNIYFDRFDGIPYFSSLTFDTNHAKKLKGFFESQKIAALGVPHHAPYVSHMTDFGTIDNSFEPLIEIYSTWGSSEYYGAPDQEPEAVLPGGFVNDALKRGIFFGFTGGGDVHNNLPGDGGLTAILAEELTVEALFGALKRRHCYACANQRMALDFYINGYPMGSILRVNSYTIDKLFPIHIAASTANTSPVDRIELIQNGEVIYSKNHREGMNDIDFHYVLEKYRSPHGREKTYGDHRVNLFRYFYIRVSLKDGSQAWSSPIWIDYRLED